jgi:chromate reductase
MYDHLASLPAFNPDEDHYPWHPEVERLRDAIHEVDGIVFSTPEYAGALPGSLKNLLDWTIGDDHVSSIYDKAVGWIDASPRGSSGAYDELRTVLAYAHARIIDAACARVPVTGTMIGPDGLIEDERSRASLVGVLTSLTVAATAGERNG